MKQYWAVLNGKMEGPFEIPELVALPGFDANVSVFISGQDEWKAAIQFPAISRYLRTGELPDELQINDAQIKILPQNWREAIVATDVSLPDIKVSPSQNEINLSRSMIKDSIRGARSTSRKVMEASTRVAHTRQGQKILLLLLGLGLFRTYQPAVDFLPTLLNQMTSDDTAMTAPKHAHKLRVPWHRIRKAFSAPLRGKVAAATPAVTAGPKVVETDSSPLPDGMIMKTVTTVSEVNGAKVYKTKTYVEAPAKKRHK